MPQNRPKSHCLSHLQEALNDANSTIAALQHKLNQTESELRQAQALITSPLRLDPVPATLQALHAQLKSITTEKLTLQALVQEQRDLAQTETAQTSLALNKLTSVFLARVCSLVS